ncbi:uncharacterized protein [Halyomorpha halys]|uniref:uncharacterized protein n=1 Tax=Halyomorpha halys TaxID=286706 RepID=UPI0034D246A3
MNSTGLTGAGVYIEELDIKLRFSLGKHSTVFQTEVFAILSASLCPEVTSCERTGITIFLESLSALQALESPRITSNLVKECKQALESLACLKKLQLVWVPGHKGITSNEKAEHLTRNGAGHPPIGPEPFLGISKRHQRKVVLDWTWKIAGKEWRDCIGLRQAKILITKPSTSKTKWLLGLNRTKLRLLIGILTGHCRHKRHLKICGVVHDETCCLCGQAPETALHYIADCGKYASLRYRLLASDRIKGNEVSSIDWESLLNFIRESKRFDIEE